MGRVRFMQDSSFVLNKATNFSYLYFPLTNNVGFKSSITPNGNGDIAIDYHHYALLPVTQEDLSNSDYGRNIWFTINQTLPINTLGNSVAQLTNPDNVDVEAGFLYHKTVRTSKLYNITTTTFIPNDKWMELSLVEFKNVTNETITLQINTAIPIYGRSPDHIRDHRHVTSLLNRAIIHPYGIINQPTYQFDESGHKPNQYCYGVFMNSSDVQIKQFWPILEEFVGEGGRLSYPKTVYQQQNNTYKIGDIVCGFEVIGAMETNEIEVTPNQVVSFVIGIGIGKDVEELVHVASECVNIESFSTLFEQSKLDWQHKVKTLEFKLKSEEFSHWLQWVSIQPIFRRIFGCSYLPHHDYGKGGRGWRDLWQDQLALILINEDGVKQSLKNNFMGVRIDGSNATIIGSNPGEFLADRNKIVRVWSDHGVWPLFTSKLYMEQSGDLSFLLEKQSYFKDKFSHYTKKVNESFTQTTNRLHTYDQQEYFGTILEHLLIQNVVPYYNVGKHGFVRLEDADWNDGLDMAKANGETVAFSAFYAYNLEMLSNLIDELIEDGITTVDVITEFVPLLTNLNLDLSNEELVIQKHQLLQSYFDSVSVSITGKVEKLSIESISTTLRKMSKQMKELIRTKEWLDSGDYGWFNGYYDNESNRFDRIEPTRRIELTGQVFSILSHVSTKEQLVKQIKAIDQHLFDSKVGGYRLNTSIETNELKLGRSFAFAYGHKENGAMFSHMAMMYAYALFDRGFAYEGHKVIDSLFEHVIDVDRSKIYPGIPEYINQRERGMYHYLTGSASWLVLNMTKQVFGVKYYKKQLLLDPKLLGQHFNNDIAQINVNIYGNNISLTYENKELLSYGDYTVGTIYVDGDLCEFESLPIGYVIRQKPKEKILVQLTRKKEGMKL
jgi:cellobiose phosphorylase